MGALRMSLPAALYCRWNIPVDTTGFCSALGMDLNQAVIDEIAEALIAQGIPVSCTIRSRVQDNTRFRYATPRLSSG